MSDIVYAEQRLASLEARQIAMERSIEKVTDAIIQLKDVSVKQAYLTEEMAKTNHDFEKYRSKIETKIEGIDSDISSASESITSHNTTIKIGGGLIGFLQVVVVALYGGYLANIDQIKQQQSDVDKRLTVIERVVQDRSKQ